MDKNNANQGNGVAAAAAAGIKRRLTLADCPTHLDSYVYCKTQLDLGLK